MAKERAIGVSLLGGLCFRPGQWHKYQRYYLMSLRATPGVRVAYANPVVQAFAWAQERRWKNAERNWEFLTRVMRKRSKKATYVGRYLLHFPTRAEPLRVAIDQHDRRAIWDPQAYDWSEVYFKVNRWPSIDYGSKTRPLVTGSGALNKARLARLVALRDRPKDLDLVFIAKLWPSVNGPTLWNPIEHLMLVFEVLAGLKIRSLLRAIVPRTHSVGFPQRYLDRLTSLGVQATYTNVTVKELWAATSSARLAFLRPGTHLCISWRMIDHLAMGASTVCDRASYVEWPVPLGAGREFSDCGCGLGPDDSLPARADYGRIADTVMELLANPEQAAEVRRAAATYYDRHVAPQQVARYLLETAEQFLGSTGLSAGLPHAASARAAPLRIAE